MSWLQIVSGLLKLANLIAGWAERKDLENVGRTLQSHDALKELNDRVKRANEVKRTNPRGDSGDKLYDRDA